MAPLLPNRRIFGRRARFSNQKHAPLTKKEWQDAFESRTGRLIDSEKVLRRIRYGGVESSIRAEVWPFLLNVYDWGSTQEEREVEKAIRREKYHELKRRCISIRQKGAWGEHHGSLTHSAIANPVGPLISFSEDFSRGSKRLTPSHSKGAPCHCVGNEGSPFQKNSMCEQARKEFNSWQHIIRMDALRIGSEWVPFSPLQASITKKVASQLAMDVGLIEDEFLEPALQHHAARMVAILEAYALYDPETGYCQGMGDLLSPFVALLDEDYQAFWCFVHFMCTVRHNFRLDEKGIQRQLQKVSKILKLSDPQLYKHLLKIDAAECVFVYRMILVLMKRELSFEQTLLFWEIVWADKRAAGLFKVNMFCAKQRKRAPPSDDLLLYVIVAAIQLKRSFILKKCKNMDDILKECNSMSGNLDVWKLLSNARILLASHHQKVAGRTLLMVLKMYVWSSDEDGHCKRWVEQHES